AFPALPALPALTFHPFRTDVDRRLHTVERVTTSLMSCGETSRNSITGLSRGMRRAAFFVVVLAILVGGCTHGSSVEPSNPPPPTNATVTCPGPVTAQSTNLQPVRVTFADPRASAAVEPVSFACAPSSGDAFPIGTTAVSCTITDARQQTFSCSFTVEVTRPP